ncbi:MAG TPA: hypothetical protein VGV93_09090 [Acidimicrobiales bacterium]|nr:hypothetical protein [Acidimicrobiales bacterium]
MARRLCRGRSRVPFLALSGTSSWRYVAIAFLLLAPLAVAVYLYRKAGTRADAV